MKWENWFEGSIIAQHCLIHLDGTDFHIQEPSPFNPMWYSHKFKGLGVQYEVRICLQTGWIVWWNGILPCRMYPDINIAQQWLIYELDKDIHEVVLADGGYKDGGQHFITSGGQHDYILKMMTDARVRHETVNKLLKDYNML